MGLSDARASRLRCALPKLENQWDSEELEYREKPLTAIRPPLGHLKLASLWRLTRHS